MTSEAIVLAGGLGTRLRSVIGELPKPMAETSGRPFLTLVLDRLVRQGIERAVLSVGYRRELIEGHFGERHGPLALAYAAEEQPLGTGGALRRSLELVRGDSAFVVNGDTLFLAPLGALEAFGRARDADVALALKPMAQSERFGTVQLDAGGRILEFAEKRAGSAAALINGGVYWLTRTAFDGLELPAAFSFERDYLTPRAGDRRFVGMVSDSYFIDIGTPEDYERARAELAALGD